MFYTIGTPKDITVLNTPNLRLKGVERKDVRIAIIDDEKFDYLGDLKFHGFDMHHFPDIETIDSLLAYEIILCDIKGIGKKFKSKYEGAHVMKEINKRYPFKTIIAYTGYTYDATFNAYLKIADNVLKKDIDRDEWIEQLDFAIKLATDPIKRWIKIRNFLLSHEVSLFNLALLEDEYVGLIMNRGDFSKFPSAKTTKGMPSDLKAVLQSFTGSILFKLVIG